MIASGRDRAWWRDGGHLTLDAAVALVDGELAPGATQRATEHVDRCLSCAAEVAAQRQARRRLRDAALPGAPTSLLSSLRAIPDSAEVPPLPPMLAADAAGRVVAPAGGTPPRTGPGAEPPAGTTALAAPEISSARGRRRLRRGLAVGLPVVVVSGVAVGAVTFGTPSTGPAPAAATLGTAPAPAPTRAVPGVVGSAAGDVEPLGATAPAHRTDDPDRDGSAGPVGSPSP